MTTRSWFGIALLALSIAGCGAGTDLSAGADPSDFDATDTEEARATSWERLVGAWEPTGSAQYAHLVFLRTAEGSAHRYFGSRVVTCVRARMPRRKALSVWKASPSCWSMKVPVPEAPGTMPPGRPSLL